MPAYNYFPTTYQPYQPTYYQPQVPQQVSQAPQQQLNSFQNTQSGMLWVGNEQEAMSYPVLPNCAVALWDSMKPIVYIKQADASGKPVLKAYELTERGINANASQQGAAYATKREIEEVSSDLESIKEEIKTIKKEMTSKRAKKEDDNDP